MSAMPPRRFPLPHGAAPDRGEAGRAPHRARPGSRPRAGTGRTGGRRHGLPGQRPKRLRPSLPVLGRAQGGEDGALILGEGPIGWTRRPSGLDGVRDAFAVFVTGDSMAPLLTGGDLVHVDPRPAPRQGDLVLVETITRTGYIKRLHSRSAQAVILSQTNPEKRLRFPADSIRHLYRVIGWQAPE